MDIYIVDIDGTVADISARKYYLDQQPVDWDNFHLACINDQPIPEVINTIQTLHRGGVTIFMVTGRSEAIRSQTEAWLRTYGIPFVMLYMRKIGDHRQDYVVKAELYERLVKDWPHGNIIAIFEDRQQVVDMYRSKGLRVFQVDEGKF